MCRAMKTRLTLTLLAIPLVLILIIPPNALTNSKGAPAARTGGPGDQALSCSASGCHDEAQDNSGNGSITVLTPTRFEPGETVEFTIRVAQSGAQRFGFQATVRRASTFGVTGTIQLADGTEFSDALGDYITHSDAKQGDGNAEWTFQWTAPDSDIGDIIIYASGVAGNANGNRFGDRVYTVNSTLPIQVSVDDESVPNNFTVQQAYPNPFTNNTTVTYSIDFPEPVRLALYDALGRLVHSSDEGILPAGTHEILIDAENLPTGTYFYEIQTPTARKTKSIVKVR